MILDAIHLLKTRAATFFARSFVCESSTSTLLQGYSPMLFVSMQASKRISQQLLMAAAHINPLGRWERLTAPGCRVQLAKNQFVHLVSPHAHACLPNQFPCARVEGEAQFRGPPLPGPIRCLNSASVP